MNNKNVTYPLLWLDKESFTFGIFRNYQELIICTQGAIKNFYKKVSFVSVNGGSLEVLEVKKVKTINPYSFSTFLWRLVGGEKIEVDIIFSDTTVSWNLNELKLEILTILDSNSERWDSDGRLNKLQKLIADSKSISELILILEKRYFLKPF